IAGKLIAPGVLPFSVSDCIPRRRLLPLLLGRQLLVGPTSVGQSIFECYSNHRVIRLTLEIGRVKRRVRRICTFSLVAESFVLRVRPLAFVYLKRRDVYFVNRPLVGFVIVVPHFKFAAGDCNHLTAEIYNEFQKLSFAVLGLSLST